MRNGLQRARRGFVATGAIVAGVFGTISGSVALAQDVDFYVRGGVAYEWSENATISDRNCAATSPPALFGCGPGSDGRSIAARGDFGQSVAFEGGFGVRVIPAVRFEAAVAHRPGFSFDGQANFRNVPGDQPVSGDVTQTTTMLHGYLDVAPLMDLDLGPVEPFLGAGVGLAFNRLDNVRYDFPGLGSPAFSRTSSGSRVDPAWMVTAGFGVRLLDDVVLDLSYRYNDYGRVETDQGPLRIVRPAADLTIDIDRTEARLTSHSVMTAIRYEF